MTLRLPLALAALAVAIAAPALAQTPAGGDTGGGVVRVEKPVTGQQVYEAVCAACHMADARGGSGAATIPAFPDKARFIRITGAGLRESHVHDVQITREAPNYPTHG